MYIYQFSVGNTEQECTGVATVCTKQISSRIKINNNKNDESNIKCCYDGGLLREIIFLSHAINRHLNSNETGMKLK